MLTKDLNNYLKEIKRVLRKGSKCFISYFLLNEISIKNISLGKSSRRFQHKVENYSYSDNKKIPEDAISYYEQYIIKNYNELGLQILNPVIYGEWSRYNKINKETNYQDVIIAQKNN